MSESDWIKVLGLILSSGVISSIIVAMLGRRREEAEAGKLSAEAKGETADAAATWVEVSIRLQEQRSKDLIRYEERINNLDEKWERKFNLIAKENEELKRERDELAALVKELEGRLAVLENGGKNGRINDK